MTTDWVSELNNMDGEALLKLLERLADAAERIAENTERPEPVNMEARPLVTMEELMRQTRTPAPADTAAGRANGFRQRLQNRLREHGEPVRDAVEFVRHQMYQEQEVVVADFLRNEGVTHLAGAPMWRIPDQYVVHAPPRMEVGRWAAEEPNIRTPIPRLDADRVWTTGANPAAPGGERTVVEEALATPAIIGQWRDYAPGQPPALTQEDLIDQAIQEHLNRPTREQAHEEGANLIGTQDNDT